MLTYQYDKNAIEIVESKNEEDVEFHIHILQEKPLAEKIKLVQKKFDENKVYTDVLFYAYENHVLRVIVRKDYYVDFILELMKHRLLQKVEWI